MPNQGRVFDTAPRPLDSGRPHFPKPRSSTNRWYRQVHQVSVNKALEPIPLLSPAPPLPPQNLESSLSQDPAVPGNPTVARALSQKFNGPWIEGDNPHSAASLERCGMAMVCWMKTDTSGSSVCNALPLTLCHGRARTAIYLS